MQNVARFPIRSKIKSALEILDRPWVYPIALLFIGLAAYGIIFTHPGFYWDDWTWVYFYDLHLNVANLHNPAILYHYLGSRPFSVWPYLFYFLFTKMTPFAWEFIALTLRWLGILFIYFTLMTVWPARVWQNRWIGVLLIVFPGFLSQPVSVAYTQHLTTYLFFSCSLFLNVYALKHRRFFWLWMALSVVLGVAQMFITEFFVTLEFIRPLLIWFMLRSQPEKKKTALGKTFLYWLPFLLGLILFMWWRFFYIPTIISGDPNPITLIKTILETPLIGLSQLFGMIIQDAWYMLVSIWAGTLSFDKFILSNSKIAMISWAVGIIAAGLFFLYIRRIPREETTTGDHTLSQALLLGCVALLGGALPVWSTGVRIEGGTWSDRFTLGPMLGVVILLVYLLDWLLRTRNQKQWLFVILLASSISLQVTNTNNYRLDWTAQQNLYWQLSWRIPNLKPGTAIIGSGTFTGKSSFYDAGYIVDLLFSNQNGPDSPFDYFDVWHLPPSSYQPNLPLVDKMQGSVFHGNTSQAVGMYFDVNHPNECVRILDPVYENDPEFNDLISNIIPISNVDSITGGESAVVPNRDIFGTEPAHTWCYYFEKADLARQLKNWPAIIKLGTQADANGLVPSSGAEYLPFIEAFAQTGQWSKAYDLSLSAQKITPGLEPVLCNNWERFQQIDTGSDKAGILANATNGFCLPIPSK